jgi:hypothetical protein
VSDAANIPAALTIIEKRKNRAVDAALVEALPDLNPPARAEALRIIAARGQQDALATLAARFNDYEPAIQFMLLERVRDLHGGIRVAVGMENIEARCAAVEFLRRSEDPRLAYLLTAALRGACPRTRGLAAKALTELAERSGRPSVDQRASAAKPDPVDYLGEALADAVRCWEAHLQPEVLRAAMRAADRTEHAIQRKLAEPRTRIDMAIGSILTGAVDPKLAGFAMRALAMPRIREHAIKVIEHATDPALLRALGESHWLLADPSIRQGLARVRRLVWADDAPAVLERISAEPALGLIRLIAASGVAGDRKAAILRAVMESEDEALGRQCLWALVDDMSQAGAVALDQIAASGRPPLAPIAARELARRGIAHGVSDAAADVSADPPGGRPPRRSTSAAGVGSDSWSRLWDKMKLEGSDRAGVPRDLRERAADLLIPLKKKLDAAIPMERIRALRIVRWMKLAMQVEEQVYRLSNDADPMVRGTAIALLAHLPGPTSLRILRRAIEDADQRVQANAVEALALLDDKECRRWVGPKLASAHGRVKANAALALLRLEMREAGDALLEMLDDPARVHRISGLWVVERLRLRTVVQRVQRLSREDADPQVRRRAARVLRGLFGKDPTEASDGQTAESELPDPQGGIES